MALVKLIKGQRYFYRGEVYNAGKIYDVDNKTRNYLVRTRHFVDHVPEAGQDDIIDLPEDVSIKDIDDEQASATSVPEAKVASLSGDGGSAVVPAKKASVTVVTSSAKAAKPVGAGVQV